MPYTATTAPPMTAWARYLDRVRRRDGLSQTGAFELARLALGLGPKSRAAFVPFLVDREPDEEEAKALASVFGWPSPDEKPAAPAPDLASAIQALADEAHGWRTTDHDQIAGLTTLVGTLVSQLQRLQEHVEQLERRAPQGKAG